MLQGTLVHHSGREVTSKNSISSAPANWKRSEQDNLRIVAFVMVEWFWMTKFKRTRHLRNRCQRGTRILLEGETETEKVPTGKYTRHAVSGRMGSLTMGSHCFCNERQLIWKCIRRFLVLSLIFSLLFLLLFTTFSCPYHKRNLRAYGCNLRIMHIAENGCYTCVCVREMMSNPNKQNYRWIIKDGEGGRGNY